MASRAGYGKISTSGLTFGYDIGDTENSYRGKPTTNLVPDASTMAGWSSYVYGNDGTFITEFGTTGYKMYNRGSWNGILKGISLPSTGTYTLSAYIRYLGGASDNNGGVIYTSGGGISDTAEGHGKCCFGEWTRVTMTRTYTTTSITFYLISYGGTYGGSYSSWEVTMPQVEAGSFATPFVNGTRSATQGLLDITGTYSIDSANVSYSSSNELSFDGTDDYLGLPNGILQETSDFTVCQIVESSAGNAGGTTFGSYPSSNLQIFYGNRFIGMYLDNASTYLGTSPWSTTLPEFTTSPTMITATRSGTVLKFYINGELKKTGSSSSTVGNSSTLFRIGTNTGGNERFTGNIDTTQVYNRALTDEEIVKNFIHYAKKYNMTIKDGSSAALAAPNAQHLYNLGIRARGTYWIKPTSYGGSAQEVYCDFDANGGWMMVASNNASVSTIPGGTARNNSNYYLNRSGVIGSPDPNGDYIIGSMIDSLEFSKVRIIGWGFASINGTYTFPNNLGTYVTAEWNLTTTGSSRYTEKVARGNVTIGGNGTVAPAAGYFVLDAVQNDASFNANTNQSTIGAAGVAASTGDPSDGCYLGHGISEGSWEGWYDTNSTVNDSQGYTTWVR
jgi:hypothetical protein